MITSILITLIICETIFVLAILGAIIALKAVNRWGEIGKGALDIAKERSAEKTD